MCRGGARGVAAVDAGLRGAERPRGRRRLGALPQPRTAEGLMGSDRLLLIEAYRSLLKGSWVF